MTKPLNALSSSPPPLIASADSPKLNLMILGALIMTGDLPLEEGDVYRCTPFEVEQATMPRADVTKASVDCKVGRTVVIKATTIRSQVQPSATPASDSSIVQIA